MHHLLGVGDAVCVGGDVGVVGAGGVIAVVGTDGADVQSIKVT